jgi:hypothetical protein
LGGDIRGRGEGKPMAAETEMDGRVPAEAEVRGAARRPGEVEDMEPAAFANFMT